MAIKFRDRLPSDREAEIERMTKRLGEAKLSERMRVKLTAQLERLKTLTDDEFAKGIGSDDLTPAP